ncbi:MAG: hypothetical protein K8R36_16335 [Planctomycetales bacterium]|nr:hypothetical protein [Planctomycetales bacterium]
MKRLILAVVLASPFVLADTSQARPLYPPLFMEEYKANPSVLKATEAEKNAAGKTFGDIIKGGKLPAP